MNRLLCWLFGHEYTAQPRLEADESEHESVLHLRRSCLCCGGAELWVRVGPERHAGSRYVWNHAHALVRRAEALAEPVWRR